MRYYKARQKIYFKTRESLSESMVVFTKWGNFITKWVKYLQIKEIKKKQSSTFVTLKELQNYTGKLFLCPPQKQAKTQPTF